MRRLCGWEHFSLIPNKSTFSRVFRDFAQNKIAVEIQAELARKTLGRNGVVHVSHDSSVIEDQITDEGNLDLHCLGLKLAEQGNARAKEALERLSQNR